VAIICDISGSMNEEGRWNHAREIIDDWLSYLQVDYCVVILFNYQVSTLPADGSLLDVRFDNLDPEGKLNPHRQKLRDQLKEVKPYGQTNTLAALEKAYQYASKENENERIQTIIIFTDGAPSDRTTGEFTPALAEKIYSLCKQHGNRVPINTIGLGNYFKPELSQFLMHVAEMTGGNFLGR
jgi:Mg-chelatase subunit ChlD